MTIVYIYVALAAYNTGYLTLPMSSIETIIDDAANLATIDSKGRIRSSYTRNIAKETQYKAKDSREKVQNRDWRSVWSIGTDAVMDVPLAGVCEVLYGERRDLESNDESDIG